MRASSMPVQVLYIAGAGRSGSSLLDLLLGLSSDVSSAGEIHRLSIRPDFMRCSCGDVLAECSFWEDVRGALERREGYEIPSWEDWPITLSATGAPDRAARFFLSSLSVVGHWPSSRVRYLRAYLDIAVRSWQVYEAVGDITGSEVVVDSTKNPLRLLALAEAGRDRLKALYLVRDGRAVAASTVRRTGVPWWRASASWTTTQVKVQAALRTLNADQKLMIRYEDLCIGPVRELNRIRQFLGLEALGAPLDVASGDSHLVPGNPMLLAGFDAIVLDERWRQEITPSSARTFNWFGGWMNRSLGYE